MTEQDLKLLEDNDWIVECESPFEMSLKDNPESRATGEAALFILVSLRDANNDEEYPLQHSVWMKILKEVSSREPKLWFTSHQLQRLLWILVEHQKYCDCCCSACCELQEEFVKLFQPEEKEKHDASTVKEEE